jgi:hypothetical protein
MNRLYELWGTIDAMFWLAVSGGIMVKVMLSEKLTFKQFGATVFAGVFCAVFFATPALDLLKLEGEYFERAIVALFALTGEHIVRRLIQFSKSGSISDVKKGL